MKFVIGGCHQGKLDWTMRKWQLTEEDIADAEWMPDKKIFYHFEKLAKKWFQYNIDPKNMIEQIKKRDCVIITDEIGCGIIPIDPEERAFREYHGRICCELAAEAVEVYRIHYGLAQRIK